MVKYEIYSAETLAAFEDFMIKEKILKVGCFYHLGSYDGMFLEYGSTHLEKTAKFLTSPAPFFEEHCYNIVLPLIREYRKFVNNKFIDELTFFIDQEGIKNYYNKLIIV